MSIINGVVIIGNIEVPLTLLSGVLHRQNLESKHRQWFCIILTFLSVRNSEV
jgi:hypothetical protein